MRTPTGTWRSKCPGHSAVTPGGLFGMSPPPPHTTRTDSNPEANANQKIPAYEWVPSLETRREPPTAPPNPQGPEDNPRPPAQ